MSHRLNAWSIFNGDLIQTLNKVYRLHKVVIGGRANQRRKGFGNQTQSHIFQLHKDIQLAGRRGQTLLVQMVLRLNHDDTFTTQLFGQHRSLIGTFAVEDL